MLSKGDLPVRLPKRTKVTCEQEVWVFCFHLLNDVIAMHAAFMQVSQKSITFDRSERQIFFMHFLCQTFRKSIGGSCICTVHHIGAQYNMFTLAPQCTAFIFWGLLSFYLPSNLYLLYYSQLPPFCSCFHPPICYQFWLKQISA